MFTEVTRVLRDGGNARIYPIRGNEMPIVESWLDHAFIPHSFKHKPHPSSNVLDRYFGPDTYDYHLLTMTK
jgi:hypothetical protein